MADPLRRLGRAPSSKSARPDTEKLFFTGLLPRFAGSDLSQKRREDWNVLFLGLAFVAASVTVVNLAMRREVSTGVTTGYALAVLTMPLWFGTAARYRYYLSILLLTVVSVASGALLTLGNAANSNISWYDAVANSALLGGSVLAAGVILWVRPVMDEWQIGILLGLGLLVTAVTARASSNPWKSWWSIPVVVLALVAAQAVHSRVLAIVALLVLAMISAVNDSRSLAGILLMVAVTLVVVALPLPDRLLHIGTGRLLVFMGVLGYVMYSVITRLALSGAFGQYTQSRTQEQVQSAGSLLLGARPEMAATAGLFLHQPVGIGSGTILNSHGIAAAQDAMAEINYDAHNDYVYQYMFGRSVELHSGVGDLWALFGWPGVVLAVVISWAILDSLARWVSARSVTPLQVTFSLLTMWNMFFGPLWSMAPFLAFSLGLLLVPRTPPSFLGFQKLELPR